MKKCKYFEIYEIVCPHIYKEYGEFTWNLIPNWMKITLDALREHFNKPITVNNYHWNGNLTQRGVRCIKCKLVQDRLKSGEVYASAHYTFQAFDFSIKGLSSQEIYDEILKNQHKFPYIRRMENISYTPTWVHVDNKPTNKKEIHVFIP